jgi:hypothetical protein
MKMHPGSGTHTGPVLNADMFCVSQAFLRHIDVRCCVEGNFRIGHEHLHLKFNIMLLSLNSWKVLTAGLQVPVIKILSRSRITLWWFRFPY